MKTTIHTGFAVLLLLLVSSHAETVRVSFLTDAAALQETVEDLRSLGCAKDALAAFQKAVDRYHESPSDFDLAKFPRPQRGFYRFESISRLVAALPHQLADTKHPYEFNCFDTMIVLAGDGLRSRVRPDEIVGPFLAPHTATNGVFGIWPAATARDAFTVVYPSWYREASAAIIPERMLDSRVSLTAALFRCYVLPMSTIEQRLGDAVMDVLRATWSPQDLKFPPKSEIVLVHEVNFPLRAFTTAHGGLLFSRKTGYTYLEKGGGTGPFLRLDFQNSAELRLWLSAMFKGAEKFGYTHHFVTFNDSKIEMLDGISR